MPEREDAIARLASGDAAERSLAAGWLYAQGCQLGDSATRAWREDPQFAALLAGPPTVGVAVLPQSFENIRGANGTPRLARVPPDQDAQEFELHIPLANGVARLDILTTRAPGAEGAIANFLRKFGEGIQQVEYFVRDVDCATEILRTHLALRSIYPQTRAGADGTRVNFFLATTAEGKKVLIELVESRPPERQDA
jgi:hypothetical protein